LLADARRRWGGRGGPSVGGRAALLATRPSGRGWRYSGGKGRAEEGCRAGGADCCRLDGNRLDDCSVAGDAAMTFSLRIQESIVHELVGVGRQP